MDITSLNLERDTCEIINPRRKICRIKNHKLFYFDNPPYDGIWLAKIMLQNMKGTKLLDIGTGTGVVSIYLCKQNKYICSTALEINHSKFEIAKKNIRSNKANTRCILINEDVFEWQPPYNMNFDTIACNPPMIPGELGFQFMHPEKNIPISFIERLLIWIKLVFTNDLDIYLHVFDFLGIDKPTGIWPSIQSLAEMYGFNIRVIARGLRPIYPKSNIRLRLFDLAAQFPTGKLLMDQEEIEIHNFIDIISKNNFKNVFVPRSIIYMQSMHK